MGYTSKSIYWIYFPNGWQIKIIQDWEFDKSYSYEEIKITAVKNPFFSFHKLEPFINSTYITPIKKEQKLLAVPSTLFITHLEVKDDNSDCFYSTPSDDDTLPLWRSSRISHKPTRYGFVAKHITLSSVVQSEICELLSYNKAIRFPEAHLWKQTIDKEAPLIYKNHIWDSVDPLAHSFILREKLVIKLKYNIDRMISCYKTCWVAKSFQK